jgi:hypothetical protein
MIQSPRSLLLILLALGGCSPSATVKYHAPVVTAGVTADIASDYKEAVRLAKFQPLGC